MNNEDLIKNLKRQRYMVLVAVRPLPSARAAWNKAIQAVIDTLVESNSTEYDRQLIEARTLMMEETL